MAGFEHNSLDIFPDVGGAGDQEITNSGPRSGTYVFRLWRNGQARLDLATAKVTLYVRLYLRSENSVAATSCFISLKDAAHLPHLRFQSDGNIRRWTGAAWSASLGDWGALSSAYQCWELYLSMSTDDSTADGDLTVRVDGDTVLTLTNIITVGTGAAQAVGGFWLGNRVGDSTGAANKRIYIDDVAINDTLGVVSNSWAGPGSILSRDPDADGALSQWTPTVGVDHYDVVNEDDDATYLLDDTPGNIDLWQKPALASYGQQIVAIGWWLRAERAAGAAEIIAEYRQLGTNWNLGSNITLTGSWDYYGYFTSENPIFAGQLTRGILDAAEFGVKSVS